MKNAAVGLIAAVGLFAVGAVCWSEAGLNAQMAEAHRRLATVHYDTDDHVEDASRFWNRLPWPAGASEGDLQRYRATVSYWLSRFDTLTDMSAASGAQAITDPHVMLVAANASWRQVPPPTLDRKLTVERLDTVIQGYADVLRKDPSSADAAFNYEFVSRVRDGLAKAPPPGKTPAPKDAKPQPQSPQVASVDLPSGPTVHGRPGAPPEGTDMEGFKTIAPMRYDEREEQMDPGRGKEMKRKG